VYRSCHTIHRKKAVQKPRLIVSAGVYFLEYLVVVANMIKQNIHTVLLHKLICFGQADIYPLWSGCSW